MLGRPTGTEEELSRWNAGLVISDITGANKRLSYSNSVHKYKFNVREYESIYEESNKGAQSHCHSYNTMWTCDSEQI